jgi:ABC-type amino acid transport substrate-binding protein
MSTSAAAALATLVFCAPGYPGDASDAQPLLDQFANAVVAASGLSKGSLAAVYDPTEEGGLRKLADSGAALAFVPYPFYLKHADQLHLTPLVQADVTDSGPEQRWTLVAKPGRITGPASMSGYTIVSTAGYAPDFVRRRVLEGWALPPDVRIEATGQVLSALRKVAAGESIAVLLDQAQAAALPSLPFAGELKVVTQSPALPVAVIALVGSRMAADRVRALTAGFLKLGRVPGGAEALAPLHLRGFVPLKIPRNASGP